MDRSLLVDGPAAVVRTTARRIARAPAGLPLDARQAHYGDNDFDTWGEFGLFMLQLLLAFLSAIVLTIAYVLRDSATRRAKQAAFERPPGAGP